ncbi:unnamed protein product [Brassica oleracea]
MTMFDDLTKDEQDSVRLLAVEGCAALGKLLEPRDCVARVLPVIVNFSQQDKSWRVRYMVANQLYELCEAVGPDCTKTDLVPAYVRLLQDNEAEHILPCVKVASVIMGMAPILGKVYELEIANISGSCDYFGLKSLIQDSTIEHLLPIFLSLLKDEFPDVRLNIISKLDQVNQLAEDQHLRVRFFDDKLGALCMQWLQDKVYSIREAGANNLKRLAEEFGSEWAMQHLVPQVVLEMVNNPHYLHMMMALRAISLMAPVTGSEITCSKFLPVVVEASKDRSKHSEPAMSSVLQGLTKSLAMTFVSEIGDKTFFAAAILAMRYPRRLVLAGCVSALIVMTILSATVGWAAPNLIPRKWTHHITTLLFFGFGLWSLWDGFKQGGGGGSEELAEVEAELDSDLKANGKATKDKVEDENKKQKRPFLTQFFSPIFLKAFSINFFGEFGDKSQLATIGLAADENPFGVILGGVFAQLLCTTAAVIGGKSLASQISERIVALSGGMLFIIFGIQSFLTSVET